MRTSATHRLWLRSPAPMITRSRTMCPPGRRGRHLRAWRPARRGERAHPTAASAQRERQAFQGLRGAHNSAYHMVHEPLGTQRHGPGGRVGPGPRCQQLLRVRPCNASGYQGRGDQEAGGAPARLGSSPDARAAAGRLGRGNGGFAGNSPDSRAVPGGPSVKAWHTPPTRTAPWRAPSAAVHAGCRPNLRDTGGNQMITRSAGQAAAARPAMTAAWRAELITSGNPRCACEPWLVSGRC
jgi:hypothetical protein